MLGTFCLLDATTVDDLRFFPNFTFARTHINEYSFVRASFFATSASSAFINTEETKQIPALFGSFDLSQLCTALELTGKPNPLQSDLQGVSLPFFTSATYQTQAGILEAEYYIWGNPYSDVGAFSIGGSMMAQRSNAAYRFKFDVVESRLAFITPSNIISIEKARKQAFAELGLVGDQASQFGFGDATLWIRNFHNWDYTAKFRQIQAGLTAAVLIPSGLVNFPAKSHAIALGYNGHWGVQFGVDGIFQIKEFMQAGLELKITQRFKKTQNIRAPVNNEPYIYGALIAPVQIIPGATLHLSPYFLLEELRPNLCVGLQYTLVHHIKDQWNDMREHKTPPITFAQPVKFSSWAYEYLTVFGLYGRRNISKVCNDLLPEFSVKIDFPVSFFNAHHVPKTYRAVVAFSIYF